MPFLEVGDGHRLWFEIAGDGPWALYLHGGPGTGCHAGAVRIFAGYRAVLLDQRGSGRSTPHASEGDLTANTTSHLLADLEALRAHLGVEKWTIFGGSWGTTLALAYAEAHPERVSAMVLALVSTTSRREVDWLTIEMGRLFPREWERFADVPDAVRHLPLVDAYATMLDASDPAIRDRAAREWCAWEDTHVSLGPGHRPYARFEEPAFRLGFARLVTHYWRHAAFLPDGQLLDQVSRLNGIPGVLLHGRYDVSSPVETAWNLHRRWSTSELHILDEGHGGPGLNDAVLAAMARVRPTGD